MFGVKPRPMQSVAGDVGNALKKQTKTMTFQTQLNCLIPTKQLESAAVVGHRFKINKSSVRTIIKKEKENHETASATMPAGM